MIKPLCDASINAMELDGDGSLFVFFKKKNTHNVNHLPSLVSLHHNHQQHHRHHH